MKLSPLIALLALVASTAQAGKMIFTDRGAGQVRSANLDGSDLQTLIPNAGTNIRGIAIDLETDDLSYADNGADIIYPARLDGSGRFPIVSTGLGFPADLALDRLQGNLYWCDRNNNRIERANYPEWIARRFRNDATTAFNGPDADPDIDGLLNKLEYFANLDPLSPQAIRSTQPAMVADEYFFTHRSASP